MEAGARGHPAPPPPLSGGGLTAQDESAFGRELKGLGPADAMPSERIYGAGAKAVIEAESQRDLRLADMMLQPLRSIGVAALYGVACLMLTAELWKAAVVALIILMALMLDLGRHMIMRFGLLLIPYAIGVWLGLLPDPASLRAVVCR